MYATPDQLWLRFGSELPSLADWQGPPTAPPTGVLQALADADNEIDGYLGGRYSLPLPSAPALLTQLACDLARYRLWIDEPPKAVAKRRDDAVLILQRIADGSVSLGMPGPVQSPRLSHVVSGGGRVFGRGDDVLGR